MGKIHLLCFWLLAVFAFIFIYLIFSNKCLIPSGINLSRKDWLSFIGTYLSFVGTTSMALMTFSQSRQFKNKDEKEKQINRQKEISPIFSLEIMETEDTPQTIKLKNVAKYPVRNVVLNDTFHFDLLPMNCEEKIEFLGKEIQFSNGYSRNKYEYPNSIVVNYEDIDGNLGYHIFNFENDIECKQFGYYKLAKKDIVITED